MSAIVKFESKSEGYVVQYEKAISCLQLCKEALSIEGLQPVDISIEALKARGKLLQDERAKQAAWELEIEKMKTAAWIANEIVKRDKPTYTTGKNRMTRLLGASGVLERAGWTATRAATACAIGRLKGVEIAQIKKSTIRNIVDVLRANDLRGRGHPTGIRPASPAYNQLMNTTSAVNPFRARLKTFDIEKLSDDLHGEERLVVRRALIEIRDWCANAVKVLK